MVRPITSVVTRSNRLIRNSSSMAKVGAGESVMIAGYVSRPMISKPATKELLGGAFAGLAYDFITQSSGSSSEQNGTHVGPGGIVFEETAGGKSAKKMVKPVFRKGRESCPPGYRLRTVNGKRMCVIQ